MEDEGLLDAYVKDVKLAGSDPMTREQEQDAFRRLRAGDQTVREQIVRANLRFAIMIARQYEGRGMPMEDLVGEANRGLLEAIERFDPDLGNKFISYAVWWIRQAIRAALANNRVVRRPGSALGVFREARDRAIEMAAEQERQVGLDEAAEDLWGTSHRTEMVLACQSELSLDAPMNEERRATFLDSLPADDQDVDLWAERQHIDALLDRLPARTKRIMRLYYGIGDDVEPMTLEQIGATMGVTRERVRQLKETALKTMRGHCVSQSTKLI